MELGATMELLGEEVGQLWGRRPPYIVGGTIQPLPPTPASQRAVLPLGQRYYHSPSRYCRWAQSGTTAVVRAVLPHMSGTTAPTAAASTIKPDTKKDPSNRGGTSTRPQRYYGWGLPVVLPLRSGTTACSTQAVLPLRPAVLPLGNQNCHNFCI